MKDLLFPERPFLFRSVNDGFPTSLVALVFPERLAIAASLQFLMNYISVTSALLAVGYFAGKILPSRTARVAVRIYAISSVIIITRANRNVANVVAIRDQMAQAY